MRSAPPPEAFFEVDGRKWRATDPHIPPSLRQELVNELMAARRAVAQDERQRRLARRRVHDAKVALGERGRAWWTDASDEEHGPRIDAAIRALLRSRRERATVCPSEPARIAGGSSWRRLMSVVRERAVALCEAVQVTILRGGQPAVGDLLRGVLRYQLAATWVDDGPGATERDGVHRRVRTPR